MKKLITYILILFCVNVFAQKTYTFDYYTVYECRTNEQDSVFSKSITIANSKNPNYFIYISIFKDKTKASISFYDFDTNEHYSFPSKGTINPEADFSSLFNTPVPFNFNLNLLRKQVVDKHDVIYQNNEIIIRRYKNRRKKKIVSDYYLIMESNEITKNQLYTSNLIFAYKFDISKVKTDKIIKESFVIEYDDKEKNNKKNIRTLKDIQPIDFTLNIPKNIKHN